MTPDEAAHHEWLQPSSTSQYIVSKTAREQSKENNESQNSLLHKYGRNQPITPNTILPEIKTPSNRIGQRFSKEKTKVMASSASDLEIAQQQYSLHRLYQTRTNGTKYGSSHHTLNTSTTNGTSNGMAHSQSTGDVTSIFGRA
uniref:CSON006804 protein n=1 Tax=Culicoides sonorensis TaxID=179676 RepID=A0A336MVH5_CULSO